MSRWPIVQRGENLISIFFVERPRLEAVGLQCRGKAAALNGVGFGRLQQSRAVAVAARRRVHPKNSDMQPAAPETAEQPAQPFAARALQEEPYRVPGREAGRSDVVRVEAVVHVIAQGLARQWIEHDLELVHNHAPAAEASSRKRTRWRASRPVASAIWCRQLVPLAASSTSGGAARTFGNTPSSPIFS